MVSRPDLVKRNKENIVQNIILKCKCGNEFKVKPSRLIHGNPTYCSIRCYHNYTHHNRSEGKTWKLSQETKTKQSLRQKRENNHNWKGGITDNRKSLCFKTWRNKIKIRDNGMCRICHNKGSDAHHLYSYNKYKDVMFELSNGVYLCKTCHTNFHSTYGFGNNTLSQFIEFIQDEARKNKDNQEDIKKTINSFQHIS